MENTTNNYSHIKGWGIDADPTNEPTHPMKHYTGDDHKRLNWERPPLQPETVEILKSNERPNLSAVLGTSVPPTGLSGAIRRYAFKYSESSYGHWLPLLLADRVNVVEGLIDDLKQGHIPNIFAEKGWKADLKYNPKGLATKVLVTALATTAVLAYLRRKK
ncbi:hypothetical protein HH214_02630 [Mucilaginibacter robiniae]|uniref:Uncharacterized protein n=1 Tax=Mucilaginibacter robiniae TaxID=2728022 RepID=A0A7L5DUS0_9SPHI|nr:hypothetical protein [Mucilaginibacter robiniae]QJD94850.1 hypothetical protein HH214_02630 [Mucilaginibacter robiniae]